MTDAQDPARSKGDGATTGRLSWWNHTRLSWGPGWAARKPRLLALTLLASWVTLCCLWWWYTDFSVVEKETERAVWSFELVPGIAAPLAVACLTPCVRAWEFDDRARSTALRIVTGAALVIIMAAIPWATWAVTALVPESWWPDPELHISHAAMFYPGSMARFSVTAVQATAVAFWATPVLGRPTTVVVVPLVMMCGMALQSNDGLPVPIAVGQTPHLGTAIGVAILAATGLAWWVRHCTRPPLAGLPE